MPDDIIMPPPRGEKKIAYRTLLNFSGGIDSLYCLWHFAKKKTPLVIHHCKLVNWTKRYRQETKAVRAALAWIDKHEPFPYVLKETTFDYGNLGDIAQDKEVIGFFTGAILKDQVRLPITHVVICSNREDISDTGYYVTSEADRFSIIEAVAKRRPTYVNPIAGKTKAELIRELPPDLLATAWFCRKPGDSNKPCRTCKTCAVVLPALKEMRKAA